MSKITKMFGYGLLLLTVASVAVAATCTTFINEMFTSSAENNPFVWHLKGAQDDSHIKLFSQAPTHTLISPTGEMSSPTVHFPESTEETSNDTTSTPNQWMVVIIVPCVFFLYSLLIVIQLKLKRWAKQRACPARKTYNTI